MPDLVIRNRRVEQNTWLALAPSESADAAAVEVPGGPVIVPLALWKAQRERLSRRPAPLGIRLEPGDDPEHVVADLAHFAIIAIHFPKFADGRGYSTAYLLRRRYGWTGELRAMGDVGRDQLFYLARAGFDSFALPAHRDPAGAMAGLDDFSTTYQSSADGALPAFRRRARSPAEPEVHG